MDPEDSLFSTTVDLQCGQFRGGNLETMPVSGITKHLLLSTLQLLELSDVKTVSSSCLLFAVSLQIDGTMVKAGIAHFDR